MRLRYRLVFLILFLITLIVTGFSITESFSFIVEDLWFAAGLLLLILASLIDQPFFSTDANIFMNGTAGLSLVLVEPVNRDFWWYFFLGWCIWLVISSYILMWINANRPGSIVQFRSMVSKINREIGKPNTLYSAFFIWGAIQQFGVNSSGIRPLFAFWVIFVLLNMPAISRALDGYLEKIFDKKNKVIDIGRLYHVSDPRVVEVRLNDECPDRIVGKVVVLETSGGERIAEAIAIDDRIIVGNRIAKIIITTAVISRWSYIAQHPEKLAFSIQDVKEIENEEEYPISIVDVGSTIRFLKFKIYPDLILKKGEIVWTLIDSGTKVYYQVTLATIVEQTTIDGNTTKSVLVTANQLGVWNDIILGFEQFSWIPPAGSLIYKLTEKNQVNFDCPPELLQVGSIPKSGFPVLAKIDDLITHNTAIVGVTGSGKSYLAFHLIESMIQNGIKVLIFDLTREYFQYLGKLTPEIINSVQELSNWYQGGSLLAIHQFDTNNSCPEMSYPEMTGNYVRTAFDQLKNIKLGPGQITPTRLCIVFEEAHSLVPEWNQVADRNDIGYVNATARTILQGRKFGMGCLIITQRTANVTKTILNQCNTMVAMRSFDQTGLDFLKNYMGSEYAQAISTLPSRDAIIVGKSSSCQSPVIFTIPDFSTRWNDRNDESEDEDIPF